MGREVRRVPEFWAHPKKPNGQYEPLFDGRRIAEWHADKARWDAGWRPEYYSRLGPEAQDRDYEAYAGECSKPEDCTPDWPDSERTHYMMYEDTSEGTPISPAFDTPEKLARWLFETKASAFGGMKASYEGWLAVARGRAACGMTMNTGTGQQISGPDMLVGSER